MKKKALSAILVSAVTVSLLAGCGSAAGGSAQPAAETGEAASASEPAASDAAAEDAPIQASGATDELQVLIWDTNQQPGLQKIIDDFTAETGIKCNLQVKDWNSYWTALEAAATGGALPDVFWMHSNNSQMYMNNDMLLNLDPYIEKSSRIDLANYMDGVTALYTYNGSHYAIPKDYDTIALWYNKTMFDEAGIAYPDATWTWDEFYEAAKKLTKEDGSQYGFGAKADANQDFYYNIIYSMGGSVLNEDKTASGYDSEETIQAMNFVAKLLTDCCPDAQTMSETGADVLFESGKIAMTTQGSWMVPALKENDYVKANGDIAVLPYDAKTGVRASICNGLGWAASATTTRPDDAWALIEWFGSKEAQLKQAELGVTMSAYHDTSDAWVNNTDAFNLQAYLDETTEKTGDAENILVYRPFTYNTTVWEGHASETFAAAWTDPSTMKDACRQAAEKMNADIANEATASN